MYTSTRERVFVFFIAGQRGPEFPRDDKRGTEMTSMFTSRLSTIALIAAATGAAHAGITDSVVTFDNGMEGFNVTGGFNDILPAGGNDGAYLNSITESFGVEWHTRSNDAFLGDYTQYDQVTLSIDVQVDSIQFFGQDATRSLAVELRNSRYSAGIFEYGSVFFVLDRNINAVNNSDWMTFSVTFDPNSTDLPAGWGGYGGSDDADGPVLPDGATFADVVSNVDQFLFSTMVPVERYPFTNFDIAVDNISISTVPAPSALALIGLSGLVGTRRRR